eukprot:CAMPEP_0113273966 /NCGR_PEP_ID=MMETSP0008_2-20120614/24142_1 /TAXON_ID=97485 /ORGANISM="Prymnesium parvum" /LENGTH=97 /DNA_ID=CAMNT_0000123537 /DNA_START=626 /DNA_END=920 /DNA_ORIENTATION=+ /assembly_acc=CAM_ASM_000153
MPAAVLAPLFREPSRELALELVPSQHGLQVLLSRQLVAHMEAELHAHAHRVANVDAAARLRAKHLPNQEVSLVLHRITLAFRRLKGHPNKQRPAKQR